MTLLRGWVDRTLWGPESGARLLIVHVGLSALIAVRIGLGPYRQLAELPDVLFDPVPFLFWLNGMPPVAVILALQVVGVFAAGAAIARWNVRWTFAIAWLCLLVLVGLRGSRGKVIHNDLLLLWGSAPFLLAPVEVTLRDRIPTRLHGWAIRSGIAVVVLIYFFAGYHKLRRSGIDWVFGDNMTNIMAWGPSKGTVAWDGVALWISDHRLAAVIAAASILGFELLIPAVLVWRRLLPWCAAVAVGLHVGTWVVLGLDYWGWIITVALLFVDWPSVVYRARSRIRRRSAPSRPAHQATGGPGAVTETRAPR